MFTGLVETVGRVVGIANQPPGRRFTVESSVLDDASIGDSIAINGCCLTVVHISADRSRFDFEAGSETLSKTNLGDLRIRSRVNLERALATGDRLGGHYVTGHVDEVGTIIERRDEPPWSHFRFRFSSRFASQVASKGSIAVDGISLTVVDVSDDSFSVALIPHTLEATTLGSKTVGSRVNLESDLIAKYVERSLMMRQSSEETP